MELELDVAETDGGAHELEKHLNLMQWNDVAGHEDHILALVRQLGGSGTRYCKERSKAMKRIISEIYSPPRVTAAAKLLPVLKCIPGFAIDLTVNDEHGNPWEFNCALNRDRARN